MLYVNTGQWPTSPPTWSPPIVEQHTLWGTSEYIPIVVPSDRQELPVVLDPTTTKSLSRLERAKANYLYSNLIPRDYRVEGKEELPCVLPYTGPLPMDVRGMDENVKGESAKLGMHGFCYDHVLMGKLNRFAALVKKARKYLCAFGMNFSAMLDAKRYEVVTALWLNRISTLALQLAGIPTIQTHALCSCRFFDISHDGLAPNCPVAIGNRLDISDPSLLKLQRLGIEELIKRKHPTVLIVVGNHLNFDPGIPVVYYKSRIQRLRNHEYNR